MTKQEYLETIKRSAVAKIGVEASETLGKRELWPWRPLDICSDTAYRYSVMLHERFPDIKALPFGWINDESGLYNDGWVVLALFDLNRQDERVMIYDCQTKKSPLINFFYASFEDWLESAEKEAKECQNYRDK